MSEDVLFLIVSTLSIFMGVGLAVFKYGKRKGAEVAAAQPNLVYASMPDMTMPGEFRIRKRAH